MPPPILFFGYGNPARGDDALGPMLAEKLCRWVSEHDLESQIEILTDFQLSPEHAYDLAGRELVIFADASTKLTEPYHWQTLIPSEPVAWVSHASTPANLLWHCHTLLGNIPKASYILALQGNTFELGETLSEIGQQALKLGWQQLHDFICQHQSALIE
ncbi:hydrogenase maturation protease [Chitinibacter sp. S2-10]|uniref:hydrogenase maturation protease n=1 Tax=Chitinibacter sp. S2-10 TaxID=3373597 RepID=UPI003977C2AA